MDGYGTPQTFIWSRNAHQKFVDDSMPQAALLSGLEGALASSDFSNFVIECGGKEYRVHRVLLGSRSKYFERLFKGTFKEASEQRLNLENDDPQVVAELIDYFYKLDLPLVLGKIEAPDDSHVIRIPPDQSEIDLLVRWARLYAASDQYEVTGMGDLVCTKLSEMLRRPTASAEEWATNWSNESVAELLRTAYANTSSQALIREVICEHILSRDLNDFLNCEKAHAAMMEHPEFLMDIFKTIAKDVSASADTCCGKYRGTVLMREHCSGVGRAGWGSQKLCASGSGASVIRSFFPGVEGIQHLASGTWSLPPAEKETPPSRRNDSNDRWSSSY